MVDVDERRNKLTPCERDTIYQRFLAQFPDHDCTTAKAWSWMRTEAKQWPISPKRVRDCIGEAIAVERGDLDQSWSWWVNCSVMQADRTIDNSRNVPLETAAPVMRAGEA